jgi:hypothetical protein
VTLKCLPLIFFDFSDFLDCGKYHVTGQLIEMVQYHGSGNGLQRIDIIESKARRGNGLKKKKE